MHKHKETIVKDKQNRSDGKYNRDWEYPRTNYEKNRTCKRPMTVVGNQTIK